MKESYAQYINDGTFILLQMFTVIVKIDEIEKKKVRI